MTSLNGMKMLQMLSIEKEFVEQEGKNKSK